MSFESTLIQINHYKKKIDKYLSSDDQEKLLCCIHKLKYLPVSVTHLEETGIGKTINALRHQNNKVGEKAKALVNKWKVMVATEDEAAEQADKSKHNETIEQNIAQDNVSNDSDVDDNKLEINEDTSFVSQLSSNSTINDHKDYNPHTSREDYRSSSTGTGHKNNASYDYEPSLSSYSQSQHNSFQGTKPNKKKLDTHESDTQKKENISNKVHKSSKSKSHDYKKYKDKKRKDKHQENHSSHKIKESEQHLSKSKKSKRSKDRHRDRDKEMKGSDCQLVNHSPTLPDVVASAACLLKSKSKTEKLTQIEKSKSNHKVEKSKRKRVDTVKSQNFGDALNMSNSNSEPSPSSNRKKHSKPKIEKCEENNLLQKHSFKLTEFDLLDCNEDKKISNHLLTDYKPLPQVPLNLSGPKDAFLNPANSEEALQQMYLSKSKQQRKIYTGKCTSSTVVLSLFDLCIKVLQENIDAIESVGDIPFYILRPVLEKATAQQLFTLEDYNPHLLEDTDQLWAMHCRRMFKSKEREDMESWRDMFLRCGDEQQARMRMVTESLSKKYLNKIPEKRTTKLAFINVPAKPPKSVARAQAKYGTASPISQLKTPQRIVQDNSKAGPSIQNSERSLPSRPPAAKKPKVAPLMGKARQMMKKVCNWR